MTLVSNKASKRLFLTTNSKFVDTKEKVDLILSPEFYWVRKFEIPVKSVAQAKDVLPTLFEDIIENISNISYHVIKQNENEFLCFAYDEKKIFEAIKSANITPTNVNSIYLAQNECKTFKNFEVDSLKFMYTKEDILVKVPNNIPLETVKLDRLINSIEFSSNKLNIKLYNNVLNSSSLKTIAAVLAVLIVLNIISFVDYKKQKMNIEEQKQNALSKSSLPSSMLQANSILEKYKTQVSNENKKREAIAYIIANKSFNLKNLVLEKNYIEAEYLSADESKVLEFLKRKYKVSEISKSSFSLKFRIEL